MQKSLDILERNVQWIALGLGGIFLLWAVYSYVVTPPAVVTIGGTTLSPGEVAPRTAEVPAKTVQVAMNDGATVHIQQLNVAQAFDEAMSGRHMALAALPAWAVGQSSKTDVGPHVGGQTSTQTRIAALPVLPPAQLVSAQSGLSVVQLPDANEANGAPNPRSRVAPAVQAAANLEDMDWVGLFFKVPAAAMKSAFEAPLKGQQIDPALYNTTVLQVEVQRQEAQGTDSATGQPIWPADDKYDVVTPVLKVFRSQVKPMPSDAATKGQEYEYWNWAENNPQLVYTPEFFQVTGGTPPPDLAAIYTGNGPNGANAGGDTTAPATGTDATTPGADQGTTPQPAAPQSQPAAPAAAHQPAAAAQGARPAANPNYFYAPLPGEDPREYGRRSYGRDFRRPDLSRRGYERGATGGRPAFPAQGFNPGMAAGQGKIDPLNMDDDLKLWVFDDTAKPGQTYRYRIVYKLRNPLFGTANLADPKLEGTFDLKSPPSPWSGPVLVPATTKFWLATLGRNNARLDLYAFNKGEWKVSHPSLTPGDLVPGTDWTVVDVRGNDTRDRDHYVLLTNDAGQMSKRDLNADRSDPAHQDMVTQTAPPPADGTTGVGTAPPISGRRPGGFRGGYRGGYRGR